MGLNAVQTHVQGLLDGLVAPGMAPDEKLDCYITPPTVEALDGPKCYVWGGTGRERRRTMPRPIGLKALTWTIDVYLVYETSSEDTNLDQAFPLLIDAVMGALRAAPMPIWITDPTTQARSQLVAIGEDFDLEYPPEMTPATQRLIYYSCRIGATVQEDLKG